MSEKTATPESQPEDFKPQLIKLALEIGPLLVFFMGTVFGQNFLDRSELLSNWFSSPIIFATATFMVAMTMSLAITWLAFRRVAVMPLVTLAMVLVFGGLTLYFQDSLFIKIKATIINSLFGTALLGGLMFRQSLLKYVFGEVYMLEPRGWQVLTVRWGIFFFFLAMLNEVAWRGAEQFFTDPDSADKFYAGFKFWAVIPITIVFSMFQLPVLNKYALGSNVEQT